ncbi:hypothetical protein HT102_06445 [Hoyosella sp. G463]|uniref:Uncharacterized protein n=1 Tax=Lolliginicoccus lacisalsi TaxID=2742202 RepID=A0A927PKV7_9ACTN|nr:MULTISPECIES: hypothetical protein [Lolliginicoccus]MBD8506118.1 hypothetical protein [Lolliginicoccus lacisalsi]
MATYRILDPAGDVSDTGDFASAEDAVTWFRNHEPRKGELGWRAEVKDDEGEWHYFEDSEEYDA